MDDNKDLAIRQDSLLTLAIEKGVDTATLEKLIALRNAEIERQAKKEFAEEFAKMQAELVPVGKSKQANDASGRKLYSYCPLEDILSAESPIIARHGFAYRWSEESVNDREKRVWCIVSGYGHEERSFVDIPYMEPTTRATNAVQMRGSATTYGKRYSFINAFGVTIAGEDNDALSLSNPSAVKAEIVPDEPDPLEATRAEIKAEVSKLVEALGAEFDGAAYFSDDEKTKYKAMIAAVNEGARAEKDIAKGLAMKLADMRKLNDAVAGELAKDNFSIPGCRVIKTTTQGRR